MICEDYALSTVAMSIYNYVAAYGVLNFDRLMHLLNQQHPGIKVEQTNDALDELKKRLWICGSKTGFRLTDEQRRPVLSRNREDASVDEKTGKTIGGWSDWLVRDSNGLLRRIEEVV